MSESWENPSEIDYKISNFQFKEGTVFPTLSIHVRTLGSLKTNSDGWATNAVLIMHGTTGSGAQFLNKIFAGRLFESGQPLSMEDHFLIMPDAIGHGQSSKPSDKLKGRFPRYCYEDSVRAHYILLTECLQVNHLRLVMGTSMGGMHTWMWGTKYPNFMDALMPLASLPNQISGRNRMWRKHIIDSIRNDPDFNGGDYQGKLRGVQFSIPLLFFMGASPLKVQQQAPDWDSADAFLDDLIEQGMQVRDPNDLAYAFDSSWDYNPRQYLKDIKAPLTAVNSADDPINPPELRILEKETQNVSNGRAIVLPITDKTSGHGTHTIAECWDEYLIDLLKRSEPKHTASL